MKNKEKLQIKFLLFLMMAFPYILTPQQIARVEELKKEIANY